MRKPPSGQRAVSDIPRLRSREKRGEELFVDCYGDAEVEGSLHVYLSEALDYPFEAEWRADGRKQKVQVLALLNDWKSNRGLMFQTMAKTQARKIPVVEVYALKPSGRIATVLDDYRAWWPYPDWEGFDENEEDEE